MWFPLIANCAMNGARGDSWRTLGQRQKQIPCGNDRQKGKGKSKGKGRSRFPAGMTDRKAKARAKARAEADSLRE